MYVLCGKIRESNIKGGEKGLKASDSGKNTKIFENLENG